MSLGSVFDQGVSGIRSGVAGVERAAQQIASGAYGEPVQAVNHSQGALPSASASPPVDAPRNGAIDGLAETVARLEQHARDVQAAALVVSAADTVLGALLGYQDS